MKTFPWGEVNDDGPPTSCGNCGERFEPVDAEHDAVCECCPDCDGQGFVEDGGCGGGCEFCRPFPKCGACNGTGKVSANMTEAARDMVADATGEEDGEL